MTEAVLWIMNFAAWSFVCGLIGWTLNEWRHEDDEFRKEFGHLQ